MITKRANPLNLPFLFGPVPVLLGNLSVPPPPRQPARSASPATDSFTVSSVGLEPEATSWLERGESLIVQQAFAPSCFDRQRCFFCFCSPVLAHTRFVCSVSILTTLPGTLLHHRIISVSSTHKPTVEKRERANEREQNL